MCLCMLTCCATSLKLGMSEGPNASDAGWCHVRQMPRRNFLRVWGKPRRFLRSCYKTPRKGSRASGTALWQSVFYSINTYKKFNEMRWALIHKRKSAKKSINAATPNGLGIWMWGGWCFIIAPTDVQSANQTYSKAWQSMELLRACKHKHAIIITCIEPCISWELATKATKGIRSRLMRQ